MFLGKRGAGGMMKWGKRGREGAKGMKRSRRKRAPNLHEQMHARR